LNTQPERGVYGVKTRPDVISDHLIVASPIELDALVGERVMAHTPEVYWEDSYANQRFASLEEALAAMRDPFYQLFIPEQERADAVLAEVREFPRYSTHISTALEIVERFSAEGQSLHLRQKQEWWIAAFGSHPESRARTAAAAICLAALHVKGVHVELREAAASHVPRVR
jgi:hypothetical protein